MKNQKKSRTLKVLSSVFNVRQWSDYDRLRTFTVYLGNGIKKMVIPQKETIEDTKNTFSNAASTLNLSEDELNLRARGLYRLSVLMCVMAVGIFGYAIYHMVYGNAKAVIVSMVVSLIALSLAFRYHYWYFQIKERKLGCTIREWYRQGLLGDKK